MKRSALACITVIVVCVTAFSQNQPRKFYEYEIVESTRPGIEVFPAPSINDNGDVAFSARLTPGGGTVFLNVMGQPNVDLLPNSPTSHFVGGRVQINNSRQIIHQTFISGTKPAQTFIRRINGAVGDYTIVAYANGAGTFDDFDQLYPSATGLNNDGEPVYTGVVNNMGTNLITGVRPNFSILNFPNSGDSLNPSISDCGAIAVRAGANPTDPIRLYDFELDSFEDIATTADGFTSLGRSPAVSDLCDVVTFYGELSAAGAEALGTNPGPGIFASIEIDTETGMRRIVRLAGRLIENNAAEGGNDDGYCDPGETCMQGELGFTSDGSPIFFSSFDDLNRVAVTHQGLGTSGIQDDIFVISFIGTPNIGNDRPERPFTNQRGLWTVTTEVRSVGGILKERPNPALPVVQVGDVVSGHAVAGINVYDQIASARLPGKPETPGDHRLGFHLATNGGNMIVRAERNVETPVVFIPGILGSRLAEVDGTTHTERWPGIGVGLFTGSNFDRLRPSAGANIVATDAVRNYISISSLPGEAYKTVLQKLSTAGGLREYQVDNKPERRTADGCDMSQGTSNPKLFVFAYDWRLSNIQNSVKLKDYVACIRRFYPGTDIDVVAHSMGGLLGRRYILDNPQDHGVRKMVTVGSPFLGAPKALDVIETGKVTSFLPAAIIQTRLLTGLTTGVKQLVTQSQAAHELFPSEGYFNLGGRPFVERTFDTNGDGTVPQIYDYSLTANFFNNRYTTMPYNTNGLFHGNPGQDDWRLDSSGVDFYHIFGDQRGRGTVEQVVFSAVARRPLSATRRDFRVKTRSGFGDGTVPRLSAERIGLANYNFGDATLRGYVSGGRSQDKEYEHGGLIRSEEVTDQVLTYLELPFQPSARNLSRIEGADPMPSYEYKANSGLNLEKLRPSATDSYYVTISGVERLDITDDLGNTNTPLGDMGFELAIPGVSYNGGIYGDQVNVGYHGLSMSSVDGEYSVKFRTGSDSIDIEVLQGPDEEAPNLAIRYIDLELPGNVECLLTFDPQGVPDLRYDSNGDGTYDVVVPAHVRVSGAAAQDVTAPAVNFAKDMATGLVSVNATDSESGVGTIYYRYDGDASFQIYTAPFVPTANSLEAFADDNVGNRSSPVTASLVSISGRVMDSSGRAVSGAFVTLTDPQGGLRTFRTNTFGYYSFDAVLTGHTYTLAVSSRRYTFEPRSVALTGELTGFDFTANP